MAKRSAISEAELEDRYEKLDTEAKRFAVHQGERFAALIVAGNEIAADKEYSDEIRGIQAVQHFLIETHHWLPSQVRALTVDDMWFALGEGSYDADEI